jgi:transposase-like protein
MIPTEGDAYALLERLRWGTEPVCPHCGTVDRATFVRPSNGVSRATRTGTRSQRRLWMCNACRKQFSALTGTVMHGTKISVQTWLMVMFEMCANKNGIAAREIERKYDLTPKTAWFLTQRIREAMKREPLAGLLSGTVIADETWIGGAPGNRPKGKRPARKRWERPHTDKQPVLSLVDARTGEVRSQVIANVRGDTLRAAIAEHVEMGATTLVTDEGRGYRQFAGEMKDHRTVNHDRDEYLRDGFSTNAAEGFFGQLKRSIDGTHHHVSREHLPRYLAEFDYRASTHTWDDSTRMRDLTSRVGGRRLTYKPLTDN